MQNANFHEKHIFSEEANYDGSIKSRHSGENPGPGFYNILICILQFTF